MYCKKCEKEVEDDVLYCPYCKTAFNGQEDIEIQGLQTDENEMKEVHPVSLNGHKDTVEPQIYSEGILKPVQTVKKEKWFHNKKKVGILGVVAFVACIAICFGIKSYMDNIAREEYVSAYNQYVDDIKTLKLEMLGGAAESEKVCNLTIKVWSNAIWETSDAETNKYTKPNGVFVKDFNDALLNMTKDETVMKSRANLSRRIDQMTEKMEKMKNPPEGLTDKYEVLKAMFDIYEEFLTAGIKISGSYTSYHQKVVDLDADFMEYYKKIDKMDLSHISK